MTDPDRILNEYEGKLAEARRKSDAIREGLANLRVTERSPDGQITVTVNDAGNLVGLDLGNSLQRKDGATVGQEVLRVVQAAQTRLAGAVQEAMAPSLGADSEAMRFLVDRLRSAHPDVPQAAGWGTPSSGIGRIEEDVPPPPPPFRRPPPPPPRPQRPAEEDDDFGGGFLR
ncbi:YbaB/EbfC family nucleoid-associated protein [Actinosynnema sp. NPDC020468]|uniref:YbaB/EbfC family nucleoid-associated protein n=1 Tax=Actinosynnema sp. NPDC020468 TaxID=3154488 RepID=UPI0033ECB285